MTKEGSAEEEGRNCLKTAWKHGIHEFHPKQETKTPHTIFFFFKLFLCTWDVGDFN